MEGKNPRRAAVDMLCDVLGSVGAKSRDALDMAAQGAGLDARDRAFVMEAAYGTIRHYYTLQWILEMFAKKPSGIPLKTKMNLCLGLYQLFFMRVPDWAAVNESVNMESRYRSLVNAVLRSAAREREAIKARMKAESDTLANEKDAAKAARTIGLLESYPQWLIRRWIERYGIAEAAELAAAGNVIPNIAIRANALANSRDELLSALRNAGIECEPTSASPVGIRLGAGVTVGMLEAFRGRFMVQDEAAQLVGLLAAPVPGMRVLDACAAPGGKAAHMAEMIMDDGEIVALDVSSRRVATMASNMADMGYRSVRVETGDVMSYSDDSGFDLALLDAPCSSIGVIRRHPDVKYRHEESALSDFGARQYEMLRHCAGLVRPGGRLLYCTCSTEPEEGGLVVGRFLAENDMFEKIGAVGGIFDGSLFYTNGEMNTLTHRDGMDGFHACAMKRRQ